MPSERDVAVYVLASWGTTNWERRTENWERYLGWVRGCGIFGRGLYCTVFFPLHLPLFGGPRQLIAWGSGGGELRATQSHLNNFRKYLHSNILFLFSSELFPCCSSKWEELKALTYEALTWQAVSAVAAAHVRLAHGPWAALCASYSHCHNNLWHCCSSPGFALPPLYHRSFSLDGMPSSGWRQLRQILKQLLLLMLSRTKEC